MSQSPYMVQLDRITKVYQIESQKVEALRSVSLNVRKGAMVAITGRSGSGKSTMLHVTGTLDTPTTGKVILGGVDVSTYSDAVSSRFRTENRFCLSDEQPPAGVFCGRERHDAGVDSWRRQVRCSFKGKRSAKSSRSWAKAESQAGRIVGVSSKEWQLLWALLMEPAILLADEPTGNLDLNSSEVVEELLLDLCRKME